MAYLVAMYEVPPKRNRGMKRALQMERFVLHFNSIEENRSCVYSFQEETLIREYLSNVAS